MKSAACRTGLLVRIANYFISPGAIERVLHDGEKLDMSIARIMHIVCELHSQFPVSQRAVALLRQSLQEPRWTS